VNITGFLVFVNLRKYYIGLFVIDRHFYRAAWNADAV